MKKKNRIKELEKLYKQATDPDEIAKNKRQSERDERKKDKIADTGL